MLQNVRYLPAIDGLRAIAVLGVFVFHLQPEFLSGGFAGVDVFFVISGFLISKNIQDTLQNGSFRFSHFYFHRIRRLYPTYLSVIGACCVASWFLLAPEEMIYFSKSVMSSLLYVSNINFWLEAGYFDIGSELKPLLHTWSLSIEEQFYLFFPLLCFVAFRYKYKLVAIFIVLLVISFLLNITIITKQPEAVFYLIPFRMWEFIVGALLTTGLYPVKLSQAFHKFMVLLGILLILVAYTLIDSGMKFPGSLALLPVLGSYLVIGASQTGVSSIVLNVLKSRIFVTTGLLSYAIYLWHWPIIIFYKYSRNDYTLDLADCAAVVCMTLALAWISTFVIEPPIRKGKFKPKHVISTAIILSTLFFSYAVYLNLSEGASHRIAYGNLYENSINLEKSYLSQYKMQGCAPWIQDQEVNRFCRKLGKSDNIEFVIWGDSHAVKFAQAMDVMFNNSFLLIFTPGCPPITGVYRHDKLDNAGYCNSGIQAKVAKALQKLHPELTVLVSRWSLYHHGWKINDQLVDVTHFLCDINCDQVANPDSSIKVFARNYYRTLRELRNHSKILVLKEAPLLQMRGEKIITLPVEQQARYIPDINEHRQNKRVVNALIDSFSLEMDFSVFDPAITLCASGSCKIYNQDYLFYLDDNHLTIAGWMTLGSQLQDKFLENGVKLLRKSD